MQGLIVRNVLALNNHDLSTDDTIDINYLAQLAYQSGTPEQQAWANWTELTDLTLLPTNRSTVSFDFLQWQKL